MEWTKEEYKMLANHCEWGLIKEITTKCKVKYANIEKNRINVLLEFPNGKTSVSTIESTGFFDNLTWLDETAKESYANVSIQMYERTFIYTPEYEIYNLARVDGNIRKKAKKLEKPEYKIEIKILTLYLKSNCFSK